MLFDKLEHPFSTTGSVGVQGTPVCHGSLLGSGTCLQCSLCLAVQPQPRGSRSKAGLVVPTLSASEALSYHGSAEH